MTGAEANKLRWALRLLKSGRVNAARAELEELAAAELSLKGPTFYGEPPELRVIEGKRA